MANCSGKLGMTCTGGPGHSRCPRDIELAINWRRRSAGTCLFLPVLNRDVAHLEVRCEGRRNVTAGVHLWLIMPGTSYRVPVPQA